MAAEISEGTSPSIKETYIFVPALSGIYTLVQRAVTVHQIYI